MDDLWCYGMLHAIKDALQDSDVSDAFWENLKRCIHIEDCCMRMAGRIQRDFNEKRSSRIAMNNAYTVTLVLEKQGKKVTASLDGKQSKQYLGYLTVIQSAIDRYLQSQKW